MVTWEENFTFSKTLYSEKGDAAEMLCLVLSLKMLMCSTLGLGSVLFISPLFCCVDSALQQLAWGKYPKHTHIYTHKTSSSDLGTNHAWCLTRDLSLFKPSWILILGLLCFYFILANVDWGQRSMKDHNHCFKTHITKQKCICRSLTSDEYKVVVKGSCGFSVPSNFRRASMSKPRLLQKPQTSV